MLSEYLNQIEEEIKNQKYRDEPKSLYDPIRYILRLGGKRVRPLLILLSYSLYRKDTKEIVPLAVALEIFHSFTLLHDDIMDNAPLRRGKSTVHEKWNVSTAILAGDIMFANVYDILLKMDPHLFQPALTRFNQCVVEICEGQQRDMELEKSMQVSEADYLAMVRKKTASLFGFSLEFGALLAGASRSDQEKLYQCGISMGTGFQLKDDLLDIYGDDEKFGKRIGGDIVSNKKTFLLISALEKAKGEDKKELLYRINESSFNAREKIAAVTDIYRRTNIAAITKNRINEFFHHSIAQIEKITPPHEKDSLINFIEYLTKRNR